MREIKVTRLFEETLNSTKPVIVHRGGSRSSKSWSILQVLIYYITNIPNVKILICRKSTPSLMATIYKDFIDLLKDYGYYQFFHHNQTYRTLTYLPNNAYVLCTGLDDPDKLKSSEFNYVFCEEVVDFDYNDYMILKTRLSGKTDRVNQLIMALNPTDAFSWVKTKLIDVDPNVHEILSNYKDNPFLQQSYIDMLESIKDQDINYYNIYALGIWGSLEHIIYNNWKEVDKYPDVLGEQIWGLDFGFSHPTSLIRIGITKEGIYLKEELYASGLTNADLIEKLKGIMPTGGARIYADSAMPGNILEIRRAGFNIYPADKAPHSVKEGLDYCKRQKLFITKDSPNLIKELRGYSYRVDRTTNQVMEEPIKINDDCCDAFRYGIHTHLCHKVDYNVVIGE